jgi:signal transduction histidine kinase
MAPAPMAAATTDPLFETWLPLQNAGHTGLAGVAQMWTDGHSLAKEFESLDRRLAIQAVLAWAAGSVIIAVLLSWAFRQLERANRELRARGEDLLRANRELTLAAKTSALGAVTAHLLHELKNPVAGLEEFVATRSEVGGQTGDGGELTAAFELTQRLRTMINDVVAVMRDEQTGTHFELTCAEVAEVAAAKVNAVAAERGVSVEIKTQTRDVLPARRGNLTVLVLRNLLQNAIEASPTSAVVTLTAMADDHTINFIVEDRGPGLSPTVREHLFHPCASTKPGGSGLGLALSQHLARQAGGHIELAKSDQSGTSFQVVLDLEA